MRGRDVPEPPPRPSVSSPSSVALDPGEHLRPAPRCCTAWASGDREVALLEQRDRAARVPPVRCARAGRAARRAAGRSGRGAARRRPARRRRAATRARVRLSPRRSIHSTSGLKVPAKTRATTTSSTITQSWVTSHTPATVARSQRDGAGRDLETDDGLVLPGRLHVNSETPPRPCTPCWANVGRRCGLSRVVGRYTRSARSRRAVPLRPRNLPSCLGFGADQPSTLAFRTFAGVREVFGAARGQGRRRARQIFTQPRSSA